MIRAKFRCMSVSQSWENIHTAAFRPVYQKKNGQESHNFEENKLFWEATPAGEATLTYQGPHEFVPGAYYYIDMSPNPEGEWRLGQLQRRGHLALQWLEVRAGAAVWRGQDDDQVRRHPQDVR